MDNQIQYHLYLREQWAKQHNQNRDIYGWEFYQEKPSRIIKPAMQKLGNIMVKLGRYLQTIATPASQPELKQSNI